jgi:hypothetical protein
MTDRYDALAGEIMRMMEDDRGLVRSKLADLLEKEVGAWKPDISIGMVASASDHSKLSLKAQLMEAHWRECRAGEDVCEWNDQALRTSSLGPPDEPVLLKRRHAIFDSEFDDEVEPTSFYPPEVEAQKAEYIREEYRKYLAERARQQTLYEFYGRNRNDTCDND